MADRSSGAEKLEDQFPGNYLSLTSYKRDGTGVATPVWFVIDGRRLLVMTDPGSFKAKRKRVARATAVLAITPLGNSENRERNGAGVA